MTEQSDIPNVSMANTKKELLEAYEAAKDRLEDLSRNLLDAEKAKKRLEKQVAAATADAQAEQDPVKRLQDLRGAIGRELTDLAERVEAEIDTYRKIQTAVEAKQEELKAIYEVETAASDLAALLDAQRAEKERFSRQMSEEKESFEAEMQQTRNQWQREQEERDRRVAEEAEVLKKQRQREKEEYEYAFAREKEQKENGLKDELHALEKEIAQMRTEAEQAAKEREAGLDAREAVVAKREKEMDALQKEVDTFPKRLENAVQAAVEDATERVTKDFEKDKILMESKFEGEKNVLTSKIDSLERLVASQATQIADLSRRHEQAYEKVQDIANRAVSSARRESYSATQRSNVASLREDEQRE